MQSRLRPLADGSESSSDFVFKSPTLVVSRVFNKLGFRILLLLSTLTLVS